MVWSRGGVHRFVAVAVALVVTLAAGGCSGDGGQAGGSEPAATGAPPATAPPPVYPGYRSETYDGGRNWLCHPHAAGENYCRRDLSTTIVRPGRPQEVEPFTPAADPPIDCFYVYPTVSADEGLNADLVPAEGQEINALLNQAARFGSVCRMFAPVYRQLTTGALNAGVAGTLDENAARQAQERAYGDVLDAWKQYIANDNGGRGVLLIGHSQGSSWLNRLLAEEIDNNPALRDRLVAAYVLGTRVAVPPGGDVGGMVQHIPLCRAPGQTGCIVTYASYPASNPPGADARFGAVDRPGMVAACTNPAALAGGSADLVAYLPTDRVKSAQPALADVTTPFIRLDGIYAGECVTRNDHSVLEITMEADPTNTRDRNLGGGLPANWGLHAADVNVAMGNLVDLARAQAAAFGHH